MDNVTTKESDGDIEGLNPRVTTRAQGSKHFSLLASPSNPNEVYVGGDPFPKLHWSSRLNRSPLPRQCQCDHHRRDPVTAVGAHLTDVQNKGISGGGTASLSSSPHADSRDMAIRADGSLLEGDDGGITVRTFPNG
jgi:hypothetical protein